MHLKVLGILQQSETLLLLRYFKKTSLDELSSLLRVTNLVLAPRSYQPYLPFKVLRAVHYSLHHVLESLVVMVAAESLVALSSLYVDFPRELSVDVVEHVVEDFPDLARGVTPLLNQAQVLEPQRPVLRVVLKTLLAKG